MTAHFSHKTREMGHPPSPHLNRLGRRKSEQKRASMREFAFGADGAAVGEHDVLGDGEAEAGSSGFAGAGLIDTIKPLKQARKMFRGDAGAEILHEKLHCVRSRARPQHDSSAGSTVLRSIL